MQRGQGKKKKERKEVLHFDKTNLSFFPCNIFFFRLYTEWPCLSVAVNSNELKHTSVSDLCPTHFSIDTFVVEIFYILLIDLESMCRQKKNQIETRNGSEE